MEQIESTACPLCFDEPPALAMLRFMKTYVIKWSRKNDHMKKGKKFHRKEGNQLSTLHVVTLYIQTHPPLPLFI